MAPFHNIVVKNDAALGIMRRRDAQDATKTWIQAFPQDIYFGVLLKRWINRAGRRFVSVGRSLPGTFPGVGYDYNDLWGDCCVIRAPMDRNEPNRNTEKDKALSIRFVRSHFVFQTVYSLA